MTIPVENNFSIKECLWFLSRGFDDCIYHINDGKIYRAFNIDNEKLLISISLSEKALTINWLAGEPSENAKEHIKHFVTNWFDIERDLSPFYDLLSGHEHLSYMPAGFSGLRFIGMPDLFEALAWGIIEQQINLTFAYKIKRRLVEHYGLSLIYDGRQYLLFPTPGVLANIKPEELRELQFSNKKAEYLINIARQFSNTALSKTRLIELPDLISRQKYLTDLKGIGIWTANYVLMKSLNEPSCIPYGDAGLANALINHNIIKERNDLKEMAKLFERFKGWESYLVFYLWRSLAPVKNT